MLKIVPQKDWDIIRGYLDDSGVVLISEETLNSFTPEQRQMIEDEANGLTNQLVDYNFGGEPEVVIDIIHNAESYAAEYIFDRAQKTTRRSDDG